MVRQGPTMSRPHEVISRAPHPDAPDVGVRHQQQILVVALEARVLDRHVVLRRARERIVGDRPRLREHFGILDPRLVMDRVGVDDRIALRHLVQLAVRNAVAGRERFRRHARRRRDRADHPIVAEIVREVRHLDDQDVALPPAARDTHRLADVRIDRRTPVQRNRPIEVVLLVEDDDVAGLLKDVIADDRRWNGAARNARREAQDAAVEILDLVLVRDDVLASGQRLRGQRDLARQLDPRPPAARSRPRAASDVR